MNGGWMETTGDRYRLGLAATSGFALLVSAVNAAGTQHDAGNLLDAFEPWVWELTSAVF